MLVMGLRLLATIHQFSAEPQGMQIEVGPGILVAFLYGPLLYLYLRAYMERQFRLGWKHLWHLLPLGIAMVLALFFADWFEAIGQPPFSPNQLPPLPIRMVGLGLASLFFVYLFFSLRRIYRFRRFVQEQASFSDPIYLRWLMWLVAVILMPLASVLLTFFLVGAPRWVPYPAFGISAMASIMLLIALLKPEMLDGLPEVLMVEEPEEIEPIRYESSPLTEIQKDRQQEKLLAFMSAKQPFLRQDLTLRQLGEQLDLNPKYLSQVINERLEQNFMDFINGYRVDKAKEMLQHPAYQHFTVLAIAQEAGFRSKSAFYEAFKKGTGMTPSAFKRSAK